MTLRKEFFILIGWPNLLYIYPLGSTTKKPRTRVYNQQKKKNKKPILPKLPWLRSIRHAYFFSTPFFFSFPSFLFLLLTPLLRISKLLTLFHCHSISPPSIILQTISPSPGEGHRRRRRCCCHHIHHFKNRRE